MDRIIWFIMIILIYNILYMITVTMNKSKLSKLKETGRAAFIIKRYGLNKKKIENKEMAKKIGFIDSFILATTFVIVSFIPSLIIQMLVALIIFIPFTLIMYHILGTYYKKKEEDNNV